MAARTKKPATMSKTTTIMPLAREGASVARFHGEDDSGVKASIRDLYMSLDTYRELGSPQVITVSIEPGDKLNV